RAERPASKTPAQAPRLAARHTVTPAIAVGSPVDFKRPADPRTWVASVTNQHDIVPTLDGQGAGTCFDPRPGWYVVDYADPTHLFPLCHGLEQYIGNLAHDLPEARDHIDTRLTPYRGPVVRTQAYQQLDRAPDPPRFPYLTVPPYTRAGAELPIRCRGGSARTASCAADRAAAAGLLTGTGFVPRPFAGRALVALHAAW